MSRIHLIGGEKGGVGKSYFARVMCQYFIDKNEPFRAIDADVSHESLARCYGDFTQLVDLEKMESADEIMNRALAAERRVVVDLPAQSSRLLERWFESGQVFDLAREMGVAIAFWHVTDGGHDSVRSLEKLLGRHGRSVKCLAVRNHGRARSFELYDASPVRGLLDRFGGHEVEFPELDASTSQTIDRTGASFWSASQRSGGSEELTPMARARTRHWLDQCYAAIDALGDVV